VAPLVLVALSFACRDQSDHDDAPLPASDSLATTQEVRASLAGEVAPGAQTYTYRQLYAGMTRVALLARVRQSSPTGALHCEPVASRPLDEHCEADVTLAPDSAPAHLDAVLTKEARAGATETAREITVTRPLPLAVDGVRLARALADAFERQTSLLDRRDASFGHHEALIRMGTLNGARQNFVEVEVKPKLGREELTVRLSRAPAPAARPTDSAPRAH